MSGINHLARARWFFYADLQEGERKVKHAAIIRTNGITGEVFIDGNKIDGVTGYTITHNAGELPELTLRLNCHLQVIGDEVLIPLPEPWRKIYKENAAL